MTRTWIPLALAGALLTLTGCPVGSADLIESLVLESTTIATGTTMAVEVVLNEDGAGAEVHWEVDGAWLSELDVPAVTFLAWDEPGTATVTVTATTSAGEDTETAEVTVVGWQVDEQAAELDLLLPSDDIPYNGVSFANPDLGWVVAGGEGYYDHPIIINYTDGEWVDATQDTVGHLHAVAANAEDDVWATGGAGLTYHWDGDDWTSFMMNGGCVHGMDFRADDDGWVTPAHGQPYMRRYTGGNVSAWATWDAPDSMGMGGVSAVAADFAFTVGNAGRIFAFDGDAWTDVDSPTNATLNDVLMLSESDGWVVGAGGTILHWNGSTWDEWDSPTSRDLLSLDALDRDRIWAVGEDGKILFYDGTGWSEADSPTDATLHGIHMLAPGDGWIVGELGTVLHLQ